MRLKIHMLSKGFPSEPFPSNGLFIYNTARILSLENDLRMTAPKAWVPPFASFFSQRYHAINQIPKKDNFRELKVTRPSFVTFPRKLFYERTGEYYWNAAKDELVTNLPDIFHVHFLYPDGSVIPHLKKMFPRIPLILSIHGSDWRVNNDISKLRPILYKNLLAADRILTVGQGLMDDICSLYPELKPKIRVNHNGIDFEGIPKLINIAEKDTFQKNKIKIFVLANYVQVKGLHILMDALRLPAMAEIDYELILAGNILDKNYYHMILDKIETYGLQSKVRTLGILPRNHVYALFSDCDFFVLPSMSEGFGVVLVEAMAFGKPVVTTRSGGPEDIVIAENGLLVPPGEASSLAEAIKRMSSAYVDYDSQEIVKDVNKRFSLSVLKDRLIAIYNEVLLEMRDK